MGKLKGSNEPKHLLQVQVFRGPNHLRYDVSCDIKCSAKRCTIKCTAPLPSSVWCCQLKVSKNLHQRSATSLSYRVHTYWIWTLQFNQEHKPHPPCHPRVQCMQPPLHNHTPSHRSSIPLNSQLRLGENSWVIKCKCAFLELNQTSVCLHLHFLLSCGSILLAGHIALLDLSHMTDLRAINFPVSQ